MYGARKVAPIFSAGNDVVERIDGARHRVGGRLESGAAGRLSC
jgi:hypothetical protein